MELDEETRSLSNCCLTLNQKTSHEFSQLSAITFHCVSLPKFGFIVRTDNVKTGRQWRFCNVQDNISEVQQRIEIPSFRIVVEEKIDEKIGINYVK